MRRLALAVVMLVALTTPMLAQDAVPALSEGVAAYERGDYATALRVFKAHAALGDADAQSGLGAMYLFGKGVPQDYAEAMKWYRLAAEQGHASAQYNLGVIYDNGEGVPQDYAEAMKWYRLAAEQGKANGEGVPQGHAEAVKWYRLAAEQGKVNAQYNLGVMYDNGEGVPRDYVRAYMWFDLAATQGHENAHKYRDIVANRMTPARIAEAQNLARERMEKHGE